MTGGVTLDPASALGTSVASTDGRPCRPVCAGADRTFEPESLRIVVAASGRPPLDRASQRVEDDIIQRDGVFVPHSAPKR